TRDHRRTEVARSAGLGDSHVADDVAVAAHDVLLSAPAAVGDHAVHDALGPGASSLTALLASLLGLLLTALGGTHLVLLAGRAGPRRAGARRHASWPSRRAR